MVTRAGEGLVALRAAHQRELNMLAARGLISPEDLGRIALATYGVDVLREFRSVLSEASSSIDRGPLYWSLRNFG